MTKQKWFFPAQTKIKNYLVETFGENGWRCNYQDVCETTIHENYQCFPKDKATTTLHFVIHLGGLVKMYSEVGFFTFP